MVRPFFWRLFILFSFIGSLPTPLYSMYLGKLPLLLWRSKPEESSSSQRNYPPDDQKIKELDKFILEISLEHTRSASWAFIINEYCSRIKLPPAKNKSEFYQRVYFEDRFKRAALLLHSYESRFTPTERPVDLSVLEELRIVPSKEIGIVDTLIKKNKISKSGRMLLARLLCSHRSIADLQENQTLIKFFEDKDQMEFHSIKSTSRYENYFMATFSQRNTSDITEIKSCIHTLKNFFPKSPEKLLALLAYSPLVNVFYDQFSFVNMVKEPNQLLCDQQNFWEEHIQRLRLFLTGLEKIASTIKSEIDFQPLATQLHNDTIKQWTVDLQHLYYNITDTVDVKELYDLLHNDFLPILEQRDLMINAYNAFAQLDVAFNLAKLMRDNDSFCFANYIEETKNPVITIDNGHCLLVKKAIPYSITFGEDQKHTALITGKNGAGKSIFMNTIGSVVHLALSLGIAPAKSCTLTPMAIRTSCNISDAIGTSLFEAQIERIASINKQTKDSNRILVLLDEPITSTRHEFANACMVAFLKRLQKRPWVISLISTHLDQPQKYVAENPKNFVNIVMNLKDHTCKKNEDLS